MSEDNKWELQLFQILRVRGNVYYLVDGKHNYTDIIIKINYLINQELLVKSDNSYILTPKGLDYFSYLCKTLRKKGLYKFLMEASDFKTTTISIEDIYIPRKRFELE